MGVYEDLLAQLEPDGRLLSQDPMTGKNLIDLFNWLKANGGGGGGSPGGSAGFVQINSGGSFGGIATTGTGNAVLSASPTLTGTATVAGQVNVTGGSAGVGGGAIFSAANTATPTFGNNTGYTLNLSGSYDAPNWGASAAEPHLIATTLNVNAGVVASTIFQNFRSDITITGSGTMSVENSCLHSNYTNNITSPGKITGPVEGYESRVDNYGDMTSFVGHLVKPVNRSTGTISGMYGVYGNLTNESTAAGSVTTFAMVDLEAATLTGGGTYPTNYFFLRNAEANACVATLGKVGIGVLGANFNPWLFVQGPDALAGTSVIQAKNSSAQILFNVNGDGSASLYKSLTIGQVASQAGSLLFLNATSGSIKVAPPTGALSNGTIVLPNVSGADTFAVLATNQTWTGTPQFNSNLRLTQQIVASLPTPAAGNIGMRATVSDASSPTFLATVSGGGSTVCPVFSNGTNWIVG